MIESHDLTMGFFLRYARIVLFSTKKYQSIIFASKKHPYSLIHK